MTDVTLAYELKGARDNAAAVYRQACDGGDSADCALPLTSTTANPAGSVPVPSPRETRGRTTLCVGTTFSAAAATAALTVILWGKFPGSSGTAVALGASTATAVASSSRVSAAGDYIGGLLYFDLSGASHYEIRVADPSSGDVDLYAWEI